MNIDASHLLNILIVQNGLDLFLVDKNSYTLFSSGIHQQWAQYLATRHALKNDIGFTLDEVKNTNPPSIFTFDLSGLIPNGEGLTLVARPSATYSAQLQREALLAALITALTLSVLSIPLAVVTACKPSKDAHRVMKLSFQNQMSTAIIDRHVPIVELNLSRQIVRCNDAMCSISGYCKTSLIGKDFNVLFHENKPQKDIIEMWRKLTEQNHWQGELFNKSREGEAFWLSAYITTTYDSDNIKTGYLCVASDISDKKKIEGLSERDLLTGLYNRNKINQLLHQEVQRTSRYGVPFCLLLIDIDHFKRINDTFGHLAGDEVLKEISKLFKFNLRQTDFVGRWGGEEFLVVCSQSNVEEGIVAANKLRKLIDEFEFDKVSHITISIGVSVYGLGSNLDKVIDLADKNLYLAKERGRNCVVSDESKYKRLFIEEKNQSGDLF